MDGIIGPWFSAPWTQADALGYEVHYVVLMAGRIETMKRAVGRSKLNKKTNAELVEIMWKQFCRLGDYERFVIDTTNRSIDETVSLIKERIDKKTHLQKLEKLAAFLNGAGIMTALT
nr:hypothetical protein [Cloacibacillus sp. An23]